MTDRYTKVGNYYVRRPQAHRVGPEQASWGDVIEIVVGTVILIVLMFGLPLLAFLLWQP